MKKSSVWQIIFEFISVVFAVLLALGLNSFKQNHDLKGESDVLKQKIVKEIRLNLTEIDSVYKANKSNVEYLDSLNNLDDLSSYTIRIESDNLSSSAWKFTQVSKAFTYIDADFLEAASRAYETQEYYTTISQQMFQNMGLILMRDAEAEVVINTSLYFLNNIQLSTETLIESYKTFLEEHDRTDNETQKE